MKTKTQRIGVITKCPEQVELEKDNNIRFRYLTLKFVPTCKAKALKI